MDEGVRGRLLFFALRLAVFKRSDAELFLEVLKEIARIVKTVMFSDGGDTLLGLKDVRGGTAQPQIVKIGGKGQARDLFKIAAEILLGDFKAGGGISYGQGAGVMGIDIT